MINLHNVLKCKTKCKIKYKTCITYYVACFDTHIAQNEITTQQTF